MFRVRRQKHEPRIELAPLIDVMLFLLTFFIYQVMMTERVDLVPMELRSYRSGTAAKPAPAATISIGLGGELFLDRVPLALDELVGKLQPLRETSPDLVVYIALAAGTSKVDRSALLLDIWDRLQPEKFNVSIVGRRNSDSAATPADQQPVAPPPQASTTSPAQPTAPTVPPGN